MLVVFICLIYPSSLACVYVWAVYISEQKKKENLTVQVNWGVVIVPLLRFQWKMCTAVSRHTFFAESTAATIFNPSIHECCSIFNCYEWPTPKEVWKQRHFFFYAHLCCSIKFTVGNWTRVQLKKKIHTNYHTHTDYYLVNIHCAHTRHTHIYSDTHTLKKIKFPIF